MKKKGVLAFDEPVTWFIMIAVLVAVLGLYIVLSSKGSAALEAFKNFWRFGR